MENIFETTKNLSDVFSDIKVGDVIRVVSNGRKYDADVVLVTGGQIGVTMAGQNYLITTSSLDGDELTTFLVKDGGRTRIKTTIKDVKKISLMRDGATINSMNVVKDKPNNEKSKEVILPFFKDAYDLIQSEFTKINENSKIVIKTGTLSTNDSINPSTVTEIEMKVVKIFKDNILKVLIQSVNGPDTQFEELIKTFLRMNLDNCLLIDQKGVKIELKTMEKPFTKVIIDNVFDIEVSEYPKPDYTPTLDDLMKDKNFRDLYHKDPTLFGKLIGQGPKGINQIDQLLKKYGVSTSYNTKNNKVKFQYSGENIKTGTNVNFKNGEIYIGRFNNSREIRLITTKRNTSIIIKLIQKQKTNTYSAKIFVNSIINGQPDSKQVGEGMIKILDNNFK